MEEGNLMDRVPVLLQRDLQFYQVREENTIYSVYILLKYLLYNYLNYLKTISKRRTNEYFRSEFVLV